MKKTRKSERKCSSEMKENKNRLLFDKSIIAIRKERYLKKAICSLRQAIRRNRKCLLKLKETIADSLQMYWKKWRNRLELWKTTKNVDFDIVKAKVIDKLLSEKTIAEKDCDKRSLKKNDRWQKRKLMKQLTRYDAIVTTSKNWCWN